MTTQEQKLAELKKARDDTLKAAEQAAHAYQCECEVGSERACAYLIYTKVRNALELTYLKMTP